MYNLSLCKQLYMIIQKTNNKKKNNKRNYDIVLEFNGFEICKYKLEKIFKSMQDRR